MKKNQSQSVRRVALELLVRIEESGSFSHLLIDQAIKKEEFNVKDRGLLTEIVYGTLQRKLTIDYILNQYMNRPVDHLWIQVLLRTSVYQMVYLDRVPDHAILHEAVEIAKHKGHKGIASLVNGVLRTVQRQGLPDFSQIVNEAERISILTSHPQWLIERWIHFYGQKTAEEMAYANLEKQSISVRVQPLKLTRDDAMQLLEEEGYKLEKSKLSPQGIIIKEGNITNSQLIREGKITIQDESSMLVGELAAVEKGHHVLDACSAPGGKATHLAEKMSNEGRLIALDLHKNKVKLIEKNAKRLDLSIIETMAHDARKLQEHVSNQTFDRIIVDAPCSGFGVLRTKPEIKYNKTVTDIERLSTIQLDILNQVAPLLKNGGKLIYSTCTVDQEENEQVVQKFLHANEHFHVDEAFVDELPMDLQHSIGLTEYGLQLFPQTYHTDGFFIVRFVKDKE